jgi:hypothetical protein
MLCRLPEIHHTPSFSIMFCAWNLAVRPLM